MMEFKARILVDTQDPELAYDQLRQALQHTGVEIRIQDTWLKNNDPMPHDAANKIALAWQRNRGVERWFGDDLSVKYQTSDPAFQTIIDNFVEGEGL